MKRTIHVLVSLLLTSGVVFAGDYEDGFAAYQEGDYATAASSWLRAAEREDAWAQYNLGILYTEGLGVARDYEQAAYWYRKAAEQGHAEAQSFFSNPKTSANSAARAKRAVNPCQNTKNALVK